jgi:ribosome-binding factor A
MSRRIERVNMLVRQEISQIMAVEMNDPRLSTLISITEVRTSSDLRRAKVYFSVLGDENTKQNVLAAMESAGGFIHRTMKRNLKLKFAPVLSFELDESIEQGTEMLDLISRNAPRDVSEEEIS